MKPKKQAEISPRRKKIEQSHAYFHGGTKAKRNFGQLEKKTSNMVPQMVLIVKSNHNICCFNW